MDRENSNKYPVFDLVSPQVEKMEEEKKEIIKELELSNRNKHDISFLYTELSPKPAGVQ